MLVLVGDLLEHAGRLIRLHALDRAADLVPERLPNLVSGACEYARMVRQPEAVCPGIVVEHHDIGTPNDTHRRGRNQGNTDDVTKDEGPRIGRAECSSVPVEATHHGSDLAVAPVF